MREYAGSVDGALRKLAPAFWYSASALTRDEAVAKESIVLCGISIYSVGLSGPVSTSKTPIGPSPFRVIAGSATSRKKSFILFT